MKNWLIGKDPDAEEDWREEEKGDDRGRDSWMASPTQWTWVWIGSRSWGWTGKPGVLQSMGSLRVGHDLATEQQQPGPKSIKSTCVLRALLLSTHTRPGPDCASPTRPADTFTVTEYSRINDEASACKRAQEFQKQEFLFCISSLWEWQLPIPEGARGFPCGSADKESACNAGELGSIPGWGRSPGEGKGYPLQYLGLENSMDCIVHGVEKSRTRLSNFHFTSLQRGCEVEKESKRKGETKLNMPDIPLPLGRMSMLCYVLSHIWLFVTPWTTACQAPLSMGFSRQEYWSGLSFPPPGDLPNTGTEAESPEWSLYHCITWEAVGGHYPTLRIYTATLFKINPAGKGLSPFYSNVTYTLHQRDQRSFQSSNETVCKEKSVWSYEIWGQKCKFILNSQPTQCHSWDNTVLETPWEQGPSTGYLPDTQSALSTHAGEATAFLTNNLRLSANKQFIVQCLKMYLGGTSLVVQWLRLCLPTQGV